MFKDMIGSIIKVNSKNGRGCSGILIAANDIFIKVQLLSGKIVVIAISNLEYVTKTQNQNIIDNPVVE